ncbi:MAG TPA: DUF4340 domain-containing protein [Gammaproteobacteria bacterium]|nr:DUF4340 domain-containing protein [Gammaproteobacteria bacterium]
MKSRWIVNLLLLVAIVILGLVTYYQPGVEQPAERAAITPLKKAQVHRIHINRPIRDDLVLVKSDNGNWQIEHTPRLPADRLQMNALLRLAEQPAVRSYPASELELDQLQLDPPYATVILNDTAVEFGNLEPIEGLRYVRVADQVHLIPDNYLQLIELSYTQFVRRALFAKGARIDAIRLPGLSLRKEDGKWAIDPEQDVSADDLQAFVERWQNASSINTRAADPLDNPEIINITLANHAGEIEFAIAARKPELILVRRDLGIQYRMGDTADSLLALVPPAAKEAE